MTLVEKALDGHRGLNLPASCTRGQCSCVRSPYLGLLSPQRVGKRAGIPNILVIMITAYINGYTPDSPMDVALLIYDSTGVNTAGYNIPVALSNGTQSADLDSEVEAAINTYLTNQGVPTPGSFVWTVATPAQVAAAILPMQVGAVKKSGFYPVVASPTVAGGVGVARFFVDSNGDGTGTAPSEIELASLQAVVVNTTASYLPQSMTADTNRKYIDVKMGQLATGLAGIIPILTGAVANAANGTIVNCTVFVKK